jgi:hypothetical protein
MSFADDKADALDRLDIAGINLAEAELRVRVAAGAVEEAAAIVTALAPDPPAPVQPFPDGTALAHDACSLSGAALRELWGGFQGVDLSRIVHHDSDGPEGGPFHEFILLDGDRAPTDRAERERVELGGRNFCIYELGSEYVTRIWRRLPPIPAAEYRTLYQWKHTDSDNIVSTSPPLSLLQQGTVLQLKERAGDYNGSVVVEWPFEPDRWFELAVQHKQAAIGSVSIYMRYEGEPWVEIWSGMVVPTAKLTNTGERLSSYPRCGIYQWSRFAALNADVGPTSVSVIG